MPRHAMGTSSSRSHLEIRNDHGGSIRLSFYKVVVTFVLLLSVLMIASGITMAVIVSAIVGSILFCPGFALMFATAWLIARIERTSPRRGDLYFDYVRLPQEDNLGPGGFDQGAATRAYAGFNRNVQNTQRK